jgi:hypothetical protein
MARGDAEFGKVIADNGPVVVACQRLPWIALPDIEIVAARRLSHWL